MRYQMKIERSRRSDEKTELFSADKLIIKFDKSFVEYDGAMYN